MIIDENKQYSVFKLEKSRKTYSNHNEIPLKQSLTAAIEKQMTIIIKCGYKQ